MLRRKKFVIGGLVVLLALGYLAFTGFQNSATYYYTVSEFRAQGALLEGENAKVEGQVLPGSIEQGSDRALKFTMVEGGQSLLVAYRGALPDTFQAGNEVVVEGHLNSAGVFQADNILTKCPSKYVPKS